MNYNANTLSKSIRIISALLLPVLADKIDSLLIIIFFQPLLQPRIPLLLLDLLKVRSLDLSKLRIRANF